MSKVTFKGYASLFECDAFDDEQEIELVVWFSGEKGVDYHPYGSTYAAAPWAVLGEVEDLELDGAPVTFQYLVDRFGKEMVDDAIKSAEDSAEEDY